jgi:hypothetical protein
MAFGLACFDLIDGPLRWAVVVVIVIAASAVWTIFAVPGDPSRPGRTALVPVPGLLRLVLELLLLGGGVLASALVGNRFLATLLSLLILVHLAFSGRRLRWLVLQR